MRLLAPVSALLLTFALAACGGDGTSGSAKTSADQGTTTSQVDTSWTADVNEICTQNQRHIREIAAKAQRQGGSRQEVAAKIIERSIPVQRDGFAALRAIDDVPDDIRPEFERWVDQLADATPLLRRLAEDLRAGRDDQRLAERFEDLAADTRPFAEQHGLDACLADAGSSG